MEVSVKTAETALCPAYSAAGDLTDAAVATAVTVGATSTCLAPRSLFDDAKPRDAARRVTAVASGIADSTFAAPLAVCRTRADHEHPSAVNGLMPVNWIAVFGSLIESAGRAGG